MKILVTGGAGFIASHVVDLYIKNGHEVAIVDDLSTGRVSNLNPSATFYELDIRSPEIADVFDEVKPDIVNHHAAQMDVRRSVADPLFDADVNIVGSLNLMENSRRLGIERFIYISTGGAVYGEPEYLPCDESHPVNPLAPYGASKHTVEHYLFMYHELYGLNYTVLRYPNVYGPRQDPHGEAGVVAIFIGQMLKDDPVTIFGDGGQERDFVHVRDCAKGNLLAIESEKNGIFNLAAGRGTTINEIFSHLRNITGYQHDAIYGPAKLGETYRIFLTSDKARRELGWEMTLGLEDGLRNTVEYFSEKEEA